jgi:hypothetical protein
VALACAPRPATSNQRTAIACYAATLAAAAWLLRAYRPTKAKELAKASQEAAFRPVPENKHDCGHPFT